jgi:hypothetical protein
MMTNALAPSAEPYCPTGIASDAELIKLCAEFTETFRRIESAFVTVQDEDERDPIISHLNSRCAKIADDVQAIRPETREGLRAMAQTLFTTEPQLANDPGAFGLNKAGNTLLSAILHTLAA